MRVPGRVCNGLDFVGTTEPELCSLCALQQVPAVVTKTSEPQASLRPWCGVFLSVLAQEWQPCYATFFRRLLSRRQLPRRQQRSPAVATQQPADEASQRQSAIKVQITSLLQRSKILSSSRTINRRMTVQGSCYGCGLPLQTAQPGVAGYVAADKATPMVQHKHNKRILCERCQELSNGRMIPAVQDFSSRQMSGSRL